MSSQRLGESSTVNRPKPPSKTYLAFGILWICAGIVFAAIFYFRQMCDYPITFRGGYVDLGEVYVATGFMVAFGVYCLWRSLLASRHHDEPPR